MSTLRSPNEMLEAAKKDMLFGQEPTTKFDWVLIMNFFACNVATGVAESACLFMRTIYDMPLSDDDVKQIVAFQVSRPQ